MGARPSLGRPNITKPYRRGHFSQRCEHAQYVSFLEPNRCFSLPFNKPLFPIIYLVLVRATARQRRQGRPTALPTLHRTLAGSALPPGIALQDVWTRRPRAQCKGLKQGLSSRDVRSVRCSSNQVVSRHNGPICHRFKVLPASAEWANNASKTGSKTQL